MHKHLQNWSTQHNPRRFAHALAPALSTAGYVPPNSTLNLEPLHYLSSDPHSCPFDISFDPYPASPPLTFHGFTSTTIGGNITISSLSPKISINPTSQDVLKNITSNAGSNLQKCERRKLGPNNKTDTSTSITIHGDTLIGDLCHQNMPLFPFAIDPLGRFGPLPQLFLFGNHPAPLLWFPLSRPNATHMYMTLLQYPSPKGILLNHNWSNHPTRCFYGHSYLAPTPSITAVQGLGVSLTKAFTHHIRYASGKFIPSSFGDPPPTYVGD